MYRSPSKSKKTKAFKFPSKKEKREKSREKEVKDKDIEKEKDKKKKDKDEKDIDKEKIFIILSNISRVDAERYSPVCEFIPSSFPPSVFKSRARSEEGDPLPRRHPQRLRIRTRR